MQENVERYIAYSRASAAAEADYHREKIRETRENTSPFNKLLHFKRFRRGIQHLEGLEDDARYWASLLDSVHDLQFDDIGNWAIIVSYNNALATVRKTYGRIGYSYTTVSNGHVCDYQTTDRLVRAYGPIVSSVMQECSLEEGQGNEGKRRKSPEEVLRSFSHRLKGFYPRRPESTRFRDPLGYLRLLDINPGVFEILTENQIQAVVKVSYKKVAQKIHPDHGGSNEAMKTLNDAMEVLGDPQKRQEYFG